MSFIRREQPRPQGLLVFQHEEKRLRSAGEIVSGFMTLLLIVLLIITRFSSPDFH